MRLNSILLPALALVLLWLLHAPATQSREGYVYHVSGDVTAAAPAEPSLGLMLMGGADWSREAWRWFVDRAGHGHIVILRASGDGADGEWILDEIGGVASVQTLVFSDRSAAFDPRVREIVAGADGIFIAGGDQSKYVRFWQDTPVETALNAHVREGRPLGGTSAGLAIMGGTGYGALAEQAVASAEALADPYGPKVTLVSDFLDLPFLEHVITDTHFSERGRLGRLIAFIAQARSDGAAQTVGLGVDEDSTLAVEADGTGRFFTTSDGHAWLVEPEGAPVFGAGGALDWPAVHITGIGPDSRIDLTTLEVSNPAFTGTGRVEGGVLAGVPEPPR
jgi:beta-aspartyl-peptidase (threonine type)